MCESQCFKKYNNHNITVQDLHKIDVYKPSVHSLSNRFNIKIINYIEKLKKQQRKNQKLIKKQEIRINEFSKYNFKSSSKYSRIDISNIHKYDYEADLKSIPKIDKSNCWNNRIMYSLMSEFDCKIHTGFDRTTIIKQAKYVNGILN